jgi:formylmethanofuran dehydrogenase subunit E
LAREQERQERQAYLLQTSAAELFDLKMPSFTLPEHARLFNTVYCEICKEGAPEAKIRLQDGKRVCLDCFKDYSRGW